MQHKQPMPYGMYRIDKEYITYMKTRLPWVIVPELTELYAGPVVMVDEDNRRIIEATAQLL